MARKDFRTFLQQAEKEDNLQIVEGADPELELYMISQLSSRQKRNPALLFDRCKGFAAGFRVCMNQSSTLRRVAILYDLPRDLDVKGYAEIFRRKLKEYQPIAPQLVKEGPILENVECDDEVNLLKFPVPRWNELDAGPYIGTRDGIITQDPDTGWINLGTYRVQLFEKNRVGQYISPGHHGRIMREKYWALGKNAPSVMIFGASPIYSDVGSMQLPWGRSELDVIGYLQGEPVPVIQGRFTGLPIPADVEIAVEGEVPPPGVETHPEGPFGEWTGYYAHGGKAEPVFHVKTLYYRKDPILLGRSGGYGPSMAQTWVAIEEAGVPDIVGVAHHAGANIAVIAIKQRYPGHAKHAALAAMGGPNAYHGRLTIVVDDDINPWDLHRVIWAVATRCDPATSIDIVRECWSTPLDPTISPERKETGDTTNSRAIINACRPFHWKEKFPREISWSPGKLEETYAKWKSILNWS